MTTAKASDARTTGNHGDPLRARERLRRAVARANTRAQLFGSSRPVELDRFVIRHFLASGATADVYAAQDRRRAAMVALKVLDPAVAPALVDALRRVQTIVHPNVVPIYEVMSLHSGLGLVVMELVTGPTLRSWIRAQSSWAAQLRVLLQAGEGVAAAHEAGVVHGDFKPEHVLVSRDGRIRVIDYCDAGATAWARHGGPQVVGTPLYMAPEQARGRRADERTDQFAFCVAALELLFGVVGVPPADRLRRAPLPASRGDHARGSAPPSRLVRVLLTGLAPEPHQRYSSMRALLDALGRCL
jgi:eukaryotic-like serine/threonine-protein kinase